MTKLRTWNSLEEKKHHFQHVTINTKDQLDEWFSRSFSEKVYFRGVNEAKFYLYSSGQRQWMINELVHTQNNYENFINQIIKETKTCHNNFISQIVGQHHYQNDFAILSFIQHFGGPTPLLDFTRQKEIALFFATDNMQRSPSEDINNYISIYAVMEGQQDLCSLSQIIRGFRENLATSEINSDPIVNGLTLDMIHRWNTPVIIDDDHGEDFGTKTNENVIAQKGLFIYNPMADKALNEFFGENIEDVTESTDKLFFGKMVCWDIHKSLAEYIQAKLRNMDITRATMYPNNEELIKEVKDKVLSNI